MEYRWSILGGIAVKQRNFLQGKAYVLGVKNQEREEIKKFPHLTKNSQGNDGGVGMIN